MHHSQVSIVFLVFTLLDWDCTTSLNQSSPNVTCNINVHACIVDCKPAKSNSLFKKKNTLFSQAHFYAPTCNKRDFPWGFRARIQLHYPIPFACMLFFFFGAVACWSPSCLVGIMRQTGWRCLSLKPR